MPTTRTLVTNLQLDDSKCQHTGAVLEKYFGWIRHVSVEPTMWFYMMAFMVTSVVEQAFFVYKACRVDHGFSEEVCANLSNDEERKKIVHVTVSNFHQWNNVAGHIVPIILAMFIGNWSDRRGRKLPLVIGLVGKFIYSFMVVVNSMMETWNLNMVIYTASIPMGLLGGDVAIFAACFAYVSDITTVQQRTMRVMILDVVYLSTMPTGVAIGGYLFKKVLNSSYSIMFTINSVLLICSILYSLVVLNWQTMDRQEPLAGKSILVDFFDKKHVAATFETLSKSRPGRGRLHLWILLIAMMLYTFQRDEKPMSYLYTQLTFNWEVINFSKFRTFQSGFFVAAMLVGVPLMNKVFKLKDTVIAIVGALSHAGGRVIFALANISELFYVGATVAALGPVVAPALRSMASKVVPSEERGKVFSMLSVCDNAIPLFSGVLYTQLFNATIDTLPSSIYWLTFASQVAVLLLILIIHFAPNFGVIDDSSIGNSDSTIETCTPLPETQKK